MLGILPKNLEVGGAEYPINSDFRNILPIFAAFNDEELSDREKIYVCMKRLFADLDSLPLENFTEGYQAALEFLEAGEHSDKPSPKIVNWEKDEQLIFPAINKVAGVPEVRELPYLHWWTFLGYFMGIDPDGVCGCVLRIRQKKARHKKLEKHEEEFYRSNMGLCRVEKSEDIKTPEDSLQTMFEELLREGSEK